MASLWKFRARLLAHSIRWCLLSHPSSWSPLPLTKRRKRREMMAWKISWMKSLFNQMQSKCMILLRRLSWSRRPWLMSPEFSFSPQVRLLFALCQCSLRTLPLSSWFRLACSFQTKCCSTISRRYRSLPARSQMKLLYLNCRHWRLYSMSPSLSATSSRIVKLRRRQWLRSRTRR